MRRRLIVLSAVALALAACAEEGTPAARGRQVYLAQCIACHHSDPAKDGPLGPALKGSSAELLEAKLLRGAYPSGYTPKRNTAIMPVQPQVKPHIAGLAAYLQ